MSIHCVYFTGDELQPCRVMKELGTKEFPSEKKQVLISRYCKTGVFITCPIYVNIEQRLMIANNARTLESTL